MLPFSLAALLLAAQGSALPTMAEIRKGMADDMRKLVSYSDQWKFDLPGNAEVEELGFTRQIDGPKGVLSVILKGQTILQSGYDGKNSWVVDHAQKVYADEPAPNLSYEKKGPFDPPADAEDGSFRFTFNGPYDFEIWAKPDLKVASLEFVKLGEVETRRVLARAERETGKIEVEMWFDKDRWRLVKARAHGGKKGEETDIIMTMIKSSFDTKFDSTAFALEQSKVAGYSKKTFDELKGGG
jgi:hypothetical protein